MTAQSDGQIEERMSLESGRDGASAGWADTFRPLAALRGETSRRPFRGTPVLRLGVEMMMKKVLLGCVASSVTLLGAGEGPTGFGAGEGPTGFGAGSAIMVHNTNTLRILQGGSRRVWSFNLWNDTWTVVGSTPDVVGPGGAISLLSQFAARDCDVALVGGRSRAFFHSGPTCDLGDPADTPASVGAGGALATNPTIPGEDLVFATRGGGTRDFWGYSASQDAWSVLPPTPAGVGGGGALVGFRPDGRGCFPAGDSFSVAALRGGNTTDFWCYALTQGSWEIGPSTPAPVGSGGSIAEVNGTIFALRGGGTSDFWRLEQVGELAWVAVASTPGPVGAGGSLVGANFRDALYALQGGGSPAVWKYDVVHDSWQHVSDVPQP